MTELLNIFYVSAPTYLCVSPYDICYYKIIFFRPSNNKKKCIDIPDLYMDPLSASPILSLINFLYLILFLSSRLCSSRVSSPPLPLKAATPPPLNAASTSGLSPASSLQAAMAEPHGGGGGFGRRLLPSPSSSRSGRGTTGGGGSPPTPMSRW